MTPLVLCNLPVMLFIISTTSASPCSRGLVCGFKEERICPNPERPCSCTCGHPAPQPSPCGGAISIGVASESYIEDDLGLSRCPTHSCGCDQKVTCLHTVNSCKCKCATKYEHCSRPWKSTCPVVYCRGEHTKRCLCTCVNPPPSHSPSRPCCNQVNQAPRPYPNSPCCQNGATTAVAPVQGRPCCQPIGGGR
ncbi:uncharacterized protein [Dermacentor andersoni]|nr:keratin-associated protein 10-1-like isoform X2 [Dermacentor andersoni]XP_054928397.1 keratin-associated protein 10-1-like isoform X2 [Dermacentor andersoni]